MYSALGDRSWSRAKDLLEKLEPARWFAVAATSAFALGAAARTAQFPSAELWKKPAPIAAFVFVGAVATGIAILNAWRLTRSRQESILSEACLQLAAYIDDACDTIKLREVGVHVWIVGGPFFARRLHRGPEFLLRSRHRSHVTFTKGKGIIGSAWASGVDQIHDLEAALKDVDEKTWREGEWEAVTGFSWEEVHRTRHYKAIWATPLFHKSSNRVVGVVSVDIQTGGAFEELARATDRETRGVELDSVLAACESALSG